MISHGVNGWNLYVQPVCLSVCLGLLRLHYAPLQWYMGYMCTIRAQYAPWCTRETIFFEKFRGPWWFFVSYVWKIGGAKSAFIPLRVAHKEHTSVSVICRLSTYVCLSVCCLWVYLSFLLTTFSHSTFTMTCCSLNVNGWTDSWPEHLNYKQIFHMNW